MPELSEEQARNVIANIRTAKGGISASDREWLLAQQRPQILEGWMNARRMASDTTKL
jgi:hypothetical protein